MSANRIIYGKSIGTDFRNQIARYYERLAEQAEKDDRTDRNYELILPSRRTGRLSWPASLVPDVKGYRQRRMMVRLSLGCIEERPNGTWECVRDAKIEGRYCPINIKRGQRFAPRCIFAGFDDFTSYLASVGVEVPATSLRDVLQSAA